MNRLGFPSNTLGWFSFIYNLKKLTVKFMFFRETTGVQMWMKFKDLWWIRKEKWSTGFLENGTKVFIVVSHLLLNASGGQVRISSRFTLTAGLHSGLAVQSFKAKRDFVGFPPPGSMPTDYELYYGFTRFAIELNELCPELKDALPRTDARFRPDQRYNITSAPGTTSC